MSYSQERKRNGNSLRPKSKISFHEGLKLWLNQWRWSSIKATWNSEYSRVHSNSSHLLDKIGGKL